MNDEEHKERQETQVQSNVGGRGQRWTFTLFGLDGDRSDGDFGANADGRHAYRDWRNAELTRLYAGDVNYVIGGLETCPRTGRVHIQGAIEFTRRRTFGYVKGLLGDRYHIEKAVSWKAAVEYCKKDGLFAESGTTVYAQGKRSDLDTIRVSCLSELFEIHC